MSHSRPVEIGIPHEQAIGAVKEALTDQGFVADERVGTVPASLAAAHPIPSA